MTAPRQILPGSTYLVTRRCAQRQFLLRPSEEVNNIFLYCLAYAAGKTSVRVHTYLAMSNHYHLVVTDVGGTLPEFEAILNRLVGKCINTLLGRTESLWSSEPYSAVRLESEDAILEKIIYTLTNPVEAGLVPSRSQWPGAGNDPRGYGGTPVIVRRPAVFFRVDGLMPESAELELTVPDAFSELTPRQFGTQLATLLKAKEQELVAEREAQGQTFLGRDAVLAQSPFDRPRSEEERSGLNPTVACRDKWRRIEALNRVREFLQAYRLAWQDFKQGIKDAVFPAGTYWMVRHAGCPAVPM